MVPGPTSPPCHGRDGRRLNVPVAGLPWRFVHVRAGVTVPESPSGRWMILTHP